MVSFDPRSIGLDTTLANDFGPFDGVGFLQRAQLTGRAAHQRSTELFTQGHDIGVLQGLVDLAMEARDHRRGCAGRREHRRGRPLMFLDESTSALDKKTEAAVLHARLPSTTMSALSHQPHTALAGCNTIALR
ncbi:hypothetical protein [Comamonas sp.]|uniref:hypothetical protein n=1 Tax=Comamonas sp. TaxID=34028 RepID=UPI003FA56838